jgi:hypothetical protein
MWRTSIHVCTLLLVLVLANGLTIGRSQDHDHDQDQDQNHGDAPKIIKRIVLTDQTGSIPATKIFIPVHDGSFRVSTFTELTNPSPESDGRSLCGTLNWSDDSPIAEQAVLIARSGIDRCVDTRGINEQPAGETVIVIRAKAGKPVTIQTTLDRPATNFSYTLFVTVEKL